MKRAHWTPGVPTRPLSIKATCCSVKYYELSRFTTLHAPQTLLHPVVNHLLDIFKLLNKKTVAVIVIMNHYSAVHFLCLCFISLFWFYLVPGVAGDLLCQKEERRQHSAKCEDHTCNWTGRVSVRMSRLFQSR